MPSLNQIRLIEQIPFDDLLSLEAITQSISLCVQMQGSMINKV